MKGRIRHLLRDLAGRNDERFVALLCEQLDCALKATERLHLALEDRGAFAGLAEEIAHLEYRADRRRDALIAELGTALTTPLDREDLFRLSRSLDDIIDNLRDFVDALTLFEIEDPSASVHPLTAIQDGLRGLRAAVELLAHGPERVTATARSTKQSTRVRQAYLEGLVEVFDGHDCVEMFKQRELLRRLDVVGLRFGEAADVLADAALKRA